MKKLENHSGRRHKIVFGIKYVVISNSFCLILAWMMSWPDILHLNYGGKFCNKTAAQADVKYACCMVLKRDDSIIYIDFFSLPYVANFLKVSLINLIF